MVTFTLQLNSEEVFVLSVLRLDNTPWSQVSSLFRPGTSLYLYRVHTGFSIPTDRGLLIDLC